PLDRIPVRSLDGRDAVGEHALAARSTARRRLAREVARRCRARERLALTSKPRLGAAGTPPAAPSAARRMHHTNRFAGGSVASNQGGGAPWHSLLASASTVRTRSASSPTTKGG